MITPFTVGNYFSGLPQLNTTVSGTQPTVSGTSHSTIHYPGDGSTSSTTSTTFPPQRLAFTSSSSRNMDGTHRGSSSGNSVSTDTLATSSNGARVSNRTSTVSNGDDYLMVDTQEQERIKGQKLDQLLNLVTNMKGKCVIL